MKTSLLCLIFLFVFSFNIQSQCNPPAALDCESSPVLCSLDELDGYSCANPDIANPTAPNPLCFGTGVPHNSNWWAFVGDGSFITMVFDFDPTDCTGQGTGCSGIQVGIMDDCGGDPLDCNANCNTSTLTLAGQTINCHTYYVWVDGCCGDVCNYTIDVGEGGAPSLPRPLPAPFLVGRACPCAVAEVCVEDLAEDCDAKKQWTVDGIDQPDSDDLECIEFEIMEKGAPIEICIIWTIGNPANPDAICDQESACFTLVPEKVAVKKDDDIFVCWEDHEGGGYDWRGEIIYKDCIDPPCRKRVQGPNDCCIDYEAKITFLKSREVQEVYKFICDKDDLPYKTEDGQKLDQETCDEEITWKDKDYYDCDTTYRLHLAVFDPVVKITQSCGDCNQLITLKADVKYSSKCMMGDLSWTGWWLNDFLDTIGIGDSLIVDDNGEYVFRLDITYEDTTNNINAQCKLSDPSWHYNVKNAEITKPKISYISPTCDEPIVIYTINNAYSNICKYNWVIKNGTGKIITPNPEDTSSISVDWTDLKSTGTLCVSVVTDCAITEDSCIDVRISSNDVTSINDSVICGLEAVIDQFSDQQSDKWTYISGPGQANISSGNQATSIMVDSFGIYQLMVEANNNGCHSINLINLHFVDVPQWSNVTIECDEKKENYRIVFNVNNGDPASLIVKDNDGNEILNNGNNSFTSMWIKNSLSSSITLSDKYNCPTISLDTVFDCMDVAVKNISTFGIKIFPNPTADFIQIMSENSLYNLYEMQINIIDVHGRVVVTPPNSDISGGIVIDLRKMTPGIYFIQLINEGEMEIIKVIKTSL